MTMVGGMQGFTMGDAAYHRNEPDYKRELAQAKELLANQTAYIKVLQEENLRMLREITDSSDEIEIGAARSKEQEALIAELVEALTGFVNYPADDADYPPPYAKARKALEKVKK